MAPSRSDPARSSWLQRLRPSVRRQDALAAKAAAREAADRAATAEYRARWLIDHDRLEASSRAAREAEPEEYEALLREHEQELAAEVEGLEYPNDWSELDEAETPYTDPDRFFLQCLDAFQTNFDLAAGPLADQVRLWEPTPDSDTPQIGLSSPTRYRGPDDVVEVTLPLGDSAPILTAWDHQQTLTFDEAVDKLDLSAADTRRVLSAAHIGLTAARDAYHEAQRREHPTPGTDALMNDHTPSTDEHLRQVFDTGLQRGREFRAAATAAVQSGDLSLATEVLTALVSDAAFLREQKLRNKFTHYATPEGQADFDRALQIRATWSGTATLPARRTDDFNSAYIASLAYNADRGSRTEGDAIRQLYPSPPISIDTDSWKDMDVRTRDSWQYGNHAIEEVQAMAVADVATRLTTQAARGQDTAALHHLSYPHPATSAVSAPSKESTAVTRSAPPLQNLSFPRAASEALHTHPSPASAGFDRTRSDPRSALNELGR